ncbi:NAD(P)/FAD-dependent oxidoreductase [Marinobacterium sp. D7]|uniref:NAD(P)/FAD-dependent oxidoreductase n=1 Tax=Marinobacterium ramblicola TaxID=2849041 RepID=UPI001C2CE03F|nr:NAD(P)/FAD-dependent oxidoreductase [Marinobacterium ramblicola]MBV1788164.1 NAD(P)/FAD-dependent oxidoreductase [Marinobacterium ramblicola]
MNIRALNPKKIAVIGSGISGLSSAWLLNRYHDVTLYEKDDRLGGHSNTVNFELDGTQVDVDTGFIVFNPLNYPNLVELFKLLEVECCDTEMTFAISANDGALEYNGTNLGGLFAQRKNLLRPRFWRMLADLLRFYRNAERMAGRQDIDRLTLGELLRDGGYGDAFIYDHLLPMGAAIWSTPVDRMLEYPARSFLNFCRNHGLVQLSDRPQWRTVVGGSRRYVEKLTASLRNPVQLNRHVQRIIREPDRVVVEDLHGKREYFDEVVLACHSDQALKLLDAPTPREQRLLGQFPYQRNRAYLHTDASLMPRNRAVWSSWNYLASGEEESKRKVSVTYWMNRLQPLATDRDIFVSLNPLVEPAPGSIVRTFFYDHPAFGASSADAQRELWSLQGQQRTWFCGAYFGYGFHEDGLQSGLAVAEQLGGISRPWQVAEPNGRIHVDYRRAHLAHG